MKALMMSIRPQWVAKILNGEKTIEIRKSIPKCDLPIDVYIYCTKAKTTFEKTLARYHDGKVVAKFTLDNWDKWKIHPEKINDPDEEDEQITKACCLTFDEIIEYSNGKPIYGWYIDNLVIFDEPKEISEFSIKVFPHRKDNLMTRYLTRAPQSWQFIEI